MSQLKLYRAAEGSRAVVFFSPSARRAWVSQDPGRRRIVLAPKRKAPGPRIARFTR